jgi:hypothetical protein
MYTCSPETMAAWNSGIASSSGAKRLSVQIPTGFKVHAYCNVSFVKA